ncbi:unnamed protein product [Closterium sp. NIES-54]
MPPPVRRGALGSCARPPPVRRGTLGSRALPPPVRRGALGSRARPPTAPSRRPGEPRAAPCCPVVAPWGPRVVPPAFPPRSCPLQPVLGFWAEECGGGGCGGARCVRRPLLLLLLRLPLLQLPLRGDVGAASASAKRRSSKGKGGRGGGGGSGGDGGGSSGGGGGGGGGGGSESGGGSGGFGGGGGGSGGGGGRGGSGSGGGRAGASQRGGSGGASESALPSLAPAEALHTFTLDPGASCCFFRDSTTLTPLSAPVPVRLADLSGGPVLARSSTVLPCPAVSSGSLLGLHLPTFSTNLVSTAALHDAMVTTTTPGGQRVSICTCTRTGRHLATFTRRPGSSLFTLVTEPPQVAASAQVFALGQVAPPCLCRLLSHLTLLWHHRLGHPSLPRLRGMHSRLLVSGLSRSLPPLPPSPAPPFLPCVEGRQHAAPHSSSFPPTTAPLQTLHMDVWGPARVSGQGRECYFLLVIDDYTCNTTVFPLSSKGEVPDVLIPWFHTVRLQLRKRFRQDLPVLRLHSIEVEASACPVRTTGPRPPSTSPVPNVLHKLRSTLFTASQCTFRCLLGAT